MQDKFNSLMKPSAVNSDHEILHDLKLFTMPQPAKTLTCRTELLPHLIDFDGWIHGIPSLVCALTGSNS